MYCGLKSEEFGVEKAQAFITAISGIAARRAIDRAVYSNSMVDVAIETCSFEHHTTEHPMTSIM